MVRIEQITSDNLAVFREVRLCGLQESPSAFGSTYAREREFTEEDWKARLQRWNGINGVGLLAVDEGVACGMAGALLDEGDARNAQLVSMWTAPAYRRKGIGRVLVDGVVQWAVKRGVRVLRLMVTSKNEAAIGFYEELGFTRTGRVEVYPNDATLVEYEMERQLHKSL